MIRLYNIKEMWENEQRKEKRVERNTVVIILIVVKTIWRFIGTIPG